MSLSSDQCPASNESEKNEQVEVDIQGKERHGQEKYISKLAQEEISKLKEELSSQTEKNRELQDRLLRLQAELENYKKRVERDKCEFYKFALEKIIKELLPVLDNFDLAIKSAKGNRNFDSFCEGIKLIYNQLHDLLEKEGLKYKCAVGETFDPCKHEAVIHIESEHHDKNEVIEEHKKGYYLKDRMLRPALVSVAKKPGKNKESKE